MQFSDARKRLSGDCPAQGRWRRLVSPIQKTIPKFDVVYLIRGMLPVSLHPTDLMTISVFEQCAASDEAMEAAKIHIIAMGAKPYFPTAWGSFH